MGAAELLFKWSEGEGYMTLVRVVERMFVSFDASSRGDAVGPAHLMSVRPPIVLWSSLGSCDDFLRCIGAGPNMKNASSLRILSSAFMHLGPNS